MQKNTNSSRKLSIEIKLYKGIDSTTPIWTFLKFEKYYGVINFGYSEHTKNRRAWAKYMRYVRWKKKNEDISKKER